MKMSTFGAMCIDVTPTADNPEILHVDIGAQNRKDTLSMQTNKDETIDQFCQRIRSMLRALANGEPRVPVEEPAPAPKPKKAQTWEEQKQELKSNA